MNAAMNANGRERKTLASQIDRLDTMLDGLAGGLDDAVAQAVQSAVAIAVKEAVQAVLTEILTNPAILARVQAAQAAHEQHADAPAPKGPGRLASWRDWIGNKFKKVGETCRASCQRLRDGSVAVAKRAARIVKTTVTAVREEAARVVATGWLLGNFLLRLAAAFGAGVAIRVSVFFTGFVLASLPGDLRAMLLAALARVVVWLRNLPTALSWWVGRRPSVQEM